MLDVRHPIVNHRFMPSSERRAGLATTSAVAWLVVALDWLLHPEQSWITGQVLGVDGGLGSVRPR
jgi:NAD(P)-dependent dehydrogenase (short-subunit alcohol dehydrogenase family)